MSFSNALYIKSLTIAEFGRFQEPTTIELAPVTFLIGANGAGKSTVGKAMMLLQEVFAKKGKAKKGKPVPVANRYRSAPGECRIWWTYHDALMSPEVQFGVRIAYGGTPKIKSYLLLVNGEVALEWSEELTDEPPFWLQQRYSFDDEKDAVTLEYHASCLAAAKENEDVRLHDRSIKYSYESSELLQIVHEVLSNKASSYLETPRLLFAINQRCFTDISQANSKKIPHTLLLTNELIVLDSTWSVEEIIPQIYKPSELEKLRADHNGNLTLETLQNLGLLDEARCMLATSKFLKSINREINIKELDQLAEYSLCKALLTVIARPYIDGLHEFVKHFSSEMPVKLANQLRDVVPLFDEKPIERALRIFANQWDSFELKSSIPYNGIDQLVTSKKDFFEKNNQFMAVDISTPMAGTQAYQFQLALQENGLADLKDMGTGFRAMLCIYAWLVSGLKDPETAMNRMANDFEYEGDEDHFDDDTGLRVTNLTTVYLEEIESALHPSAQTDLFRLILNSQPTDGRIWADQVMGGFSLFGEKTEEEKAEEDRKRAEEVAAAPKQRQLDRLKTRRPLIFETHSEYIVRAALNMVASGERPADHFAINYIHAPGLQLENEPAAYHIGIRKNGTLMREFGPGFFDESQRLKLEMIKNARITKEQSN